MLGLLLGIVVCWVTVRVFIELIKISWSLTVFVGGLILVPVVIIGAVASNVLAIFGFIVLLVIVLAAIASIL